MIIKATNELEFTHDELDLKKIQLPAVVSKGAYTTSLDFILITHSFELLSHSAYKLKAYTI